MITCRRVLGLLSASIVLMSLQSCGFFDSDDDADNNGTSEICTPGEILCAGDELIRCANDGKAFTTLTICNYGCKAGDCLPKPGCTPKCDGKECGEDGCGSNCGLCENGKACSKGKCVALAGFCTPHELRCVNLELQRCADDGSKWVLQQQCEYSCSAGACGSKPGCTPKCAGKQCGDDGCAGSCGQCSGTDICVNGVCVQQLQQCQPKCTGRECGPDGCGGLCGICASGTACNVATGKCVAIQSGVVKGTLQFDFMTVADNNYGGLQLVGPSSMPAAGLLVLVYSADGGTLLGAAEIDENGAFQVPVGAPLTGNEQVIAMCAWSPDWSSDAPLPLMILDAEAGGNPATGSHPVWAWSMKIDQYGNAGSLKLGVENGSGAAFLFLVSRSAMETVMFDFLKGDYARLISLGVLWHPGTSWTCGSCYSTIPQNANDGTKLVDASVFIGGGSNESSAWGCPVVLHEIGHYVAASYSRDDSPGGSHYFGEPIAPAFAWSEGWANFFAVSTYSRLVGEPNALYWDIQPGSSYWIDYDAAISSDQGKPKPSSPNLGMMQDLDENWVTVMLWHLWDGADLPDPKGDGTALGTDGVVAAVTTQRFLNMDRAAKGADFVDFVDSAICEFPNIAQSIYDTVTQVLEFPHDGEPLCSYQPKAPMSISIDVNREGNDTVVTAVVSTEGKLPANVILDLDVGRNTVLLAGSITENLGHLAIGSRLERTWRLRGQVDGGAVRASSISPAAGAFAEAIWPEKKQHVVRPKASPIAPVTFRGLRIDRAYSLQKVD